MFKVWYVNDPFNILIVAALYKREKGPEWICDIWRSLDLEEQPNGKYAWLMQQLAITTSPQFYKRRGCKRWGSIGDFATGFAGMNICAVGFKMCAMGKLALVGVADYPLQ